MNRAETSSFAHPVQRKYASDKNKNIVHIKPIKISFLDN
jgi:hypothetical protein